MMTVPNPGRLTVVVRLPVIQINGPRNPVRSIPERPKVRLSVQRIVCLSTETDVYP